MTRVLFRLRIVLPVMFLAVSPIAAQSPGIESRLAGFDAYMAQVLKDWNVPGIGVASS